MKRWIATTLTIVMATPPVYTQDDGSGPLTPAQREAFAAAGIEDINNENFPQLIESFDFPNAELADVVKAISELTGKNFIIDSGLRGRITIIAPTQITVAEAYRAFLSALAVNRFTVVPSGQFLKIVSARDAQRDNIEVYSGDYFPNTDQMITRIIHLKHISAAAVNRELRMLPSKEGEVYVYEPTNTLIISDFGSNLERVMNIIRQIDVPGFEEQLEVIPVKHASARDIAQLVDQIVNKDQGGGAAAGGRGATTARGSFRSRFTRGGAQGGSDNSSQASFMVIPDERTNSLIIVGNRAGINKVKKLVGQLDYKMSPDEAGGVYVYYVKHGEAAKISQTLSGVAQADQGGAQRRGALPPRGAAPLPPAGQSIFGGEVTITADEETNSLVIVASRQDYEAVLGLLDKIDIPRDQVFVEAIIMELSEDMNSSFGLSYFNFNEGTNGLGRQGFNGIGDGLATRVANPLAGSGTILSFATGGLVDIEVGGQKHTVGSLTGYINLLKGNSRTNILSTPQIVAMDNEPALIEVGERVPTSFNRQVDPTGSVSTTANFEDATIRLEIRPFISPTSDSVRMEIDQQIKQPKGETPTNLESQALTLTTRTVQTNIVIPNGDTAVLGGLMRDVKIDTETKVPVLGDLPILGWLFKSTTKQDTKVNLLVFLTPKIIRNASDSRVLLGRKLDQRLDFIKKSGGVDPFGDTVEEIQRKAESANLNSEDDEFEDLPF